MMDWKVLVACVVSLAVVSTALTGGFTGNGFLGDIFSGINKWLNDSPLKGIFSPAPEKAGTQTETVDIIIEAQNMTINQDSMVAISSDDITLINFKGTVFVDFSGRFIMLNETQTWLSMKMPLQTMVMTGANFKRFAVDNTHMRSRVGNWTETTEAGSIQVFGFTSEVKITPGNIEFAGNATKVLKV